MFAGVNTSISKKDFGCQAGVSYVDQDNSLENDTPEIEEEIDDDLNDADYEFSDDESYIFE